MKHRTALTAVRHRLEYMVFRLILCGLQALPMRVCAWLAARMAGIIGLLPRKLTRHEIARANLRIAFGDRYTDAELDDIIHRMWVHLFRMVGEMAHAQRKMRLDNVYQYITFRNKQQVIEALCSGRPVILLAGHYGNWEIAISVFGLFGFRMGVVGRDIDNPLVNDWVRRFRQATGHSAISKKGGADEIIQRMEAGSSVAMLGDQDAGSRGLFVDFFGRPASTFKSIALLALQYNALICVGYARRLEDDFARHPFGRFELGCEEVIDPLELPGGGDVRELTQRYTAALERAIRLSPEQYFWVHRRWKSEPGRRRRRPAARRAA